jgi:(1->4)-alpha-D-glucan 1-alpha-D-glucosylmutase
MRIPASTYRLQVTPDFGLVEAAARLPYLHDLGVDWVYLSPLLQAAAGSSHGYDVVDPSRVDGSRGGEKGLDLLSREARRLGMGVLVDVVPNHMGVAVPEQNAWWWDLLRHGRGSSYADAFDVDWEAGDGRILLPVVGDDDVLPGGRIGGLAVDDDRLRYHDTAFPVAPGTEGTDHDEVHERQHYRLVHWRRGDSDLNYRRFFTITTLAGVRVEDAEVLGASHGEIRRWFEEGLVDGLRVDHPDGLRYPRDYLGDLATLTAGAYVVVEKILERDESLPRSWPTAGTTGYDALGLIDRVLVDPAGEVPLDALESRLRGGPSSWPDVTHDTRRAVADGPLRAEVRRIVREILPLVEEGALAQVARPRKREVLEDAVAEVLASFPVYRSYLPEGQEHLDAALAEAHARRPDLGITLDVLAPLLADPDEPAARRFQQTSGMVMAKGVEDCAFYRSSRLTSLNEVGGDPSHFAVSVAEFHDAMAARQAAWPHAMTATTTHDTKRSEDTRARIAVLAEVPDLWEAALDRLLSLAPLPDPGFGSLLWQAVLGAWPATRERLHQYAEKAMREAGDHTTWTDPDAAYEEAVHAAVDAAFDSADVRSVLEELVALVAEPGRSNGLATKLLALTSPGVPDVYQGTELWDHSLADPDNRRPVDFDERARLLAGPAAHPKLLVTTTALRLRRDRPELFVSYAPVEAVGDAADHVVAFDRGGAVTLVTRLPVGLTRRGGWGDTTLASAGTWTNQLTGVSAGSSGAGVRLADVLGRLPVALLAREDG